MFRNFHKSLINILKLAGRNILPIKTQANLCDFAIRNLGNAIRNFCMVLIKKNLYRPGES